MRIALGSRALEEQDEEAAERHFLAAEKAFPGFDDPSLAAERRLADLYAAQDRRDEALAARERWLRFESGDLEGRRSVAAWHVENGRLEPALEQLREANEIDPFLRGLHREWGDALRAAGRHEEALREYRVGPLVPGELDLERPGPLSSEEHAEWLALEAATLADLDRDGEAIEVARKALELDADCELARETLLELQ